MAPARKRKSDELAEPSTPEASSTPALKKMRITQSQKQALIDNLQLEITERARHLRAHYALQCADLRSRIERRVNRIPMSMRTVTMEELMEKSRPVPAAAPIPPPKPIVVTKSQAPSQMPAPAKPTAPGASRPTRKRKSSINIATDPIQKSYNEIEEDTITVVRAAPAVALPKPRATKRGSRTNNKAGILSPRSHNSRTLPRSPLKPATTTTSTSLADCHPPLTSPTKPTHTRPLPPLKPASPLKVAALATTSAISSSMHTILASAKSTATRSKSVRNAQPRTVSQTSTHSATSTTSTGTVVKNMARAVRNRAGGAAKKTTAHAAAAAAAEQPAAAAVPAVKSKAGTVKKATAATAASRKVAAAALEPTSATATAGRRILRKRN